jgi:MFS family permease
MAAVLGWLGRLHPFRTLDAQRLALLFAVVYFSQGMWYLPNQTITVVLKERGLSAGQVAGFFSITLIPWVIKPVYGLISDFVPLFGYRRKSYFLLSSGLGAVAGAVLAFMPHHEYWPLAVFFTVMGLGLAFTDVLTDALMVESGRPRGLTGAFQSVQWASINTATILVGIVGGYFAAKRELHTVFALAACFPVVSFAMAFLFVHESPARSERAAFLETWAAIRAALRGRDVWVVAGFILFWTFSPSFGPALLFYQMDKLGFSQQFIGFLGSLAGVGFIVGAIIYAPLSRRVPLKRLINLSVGISVAATLAYLLYRGRTSAMVIDITFGCLGMITQLALLDLAAKSCPKRVEATFFALLMSIFNLGTQGSQVVGGYLYDILGYVPLIFISAAATAATWLLVPLVKVERIEAKARAETGAVATTA